MSILEGEGIRPQLIGENKIPAASEDTAGENATTVARYCLFATGGQFGSHVD